MITDFTFKINFKMLSDMLEDASFTSRIGRKFASIAIELGDIGKGVKLGKEFAVSLFLFELFSGANGFFLRDDSSVKNGIFEKNTFSKNWVFVLADELEAS
mgnify:CR=1 FL=1